MKKSIFLLFISLFYLSLPSWGWGRLGHHAVAYIAECNISEKTFQTLDYYLDGRNMRFYANWLDEYKDEPEYRMTAPWHTVLVDKNCQYTPKADGDIISALEEAIRILQNYKSQDDSTVAANIRYIIHLIGDMHTPVHIDYVDAKADYFVKLNNHPILYHLVWDVDVMVRPYKWSYTEWQKQVDTCTREEQKRITSGTLREWLHECAVASRVIYELAQPDQALDAEFFLKAHPLVKQQIRNSGYRLAKVLNDLFDR